MNVTSKVCELEGCEKIPTFNFEGESKARFCKLHKLYGMINVSIRLCEEEGCDKTPSFSGLGGDSKARFCKVKLIIIITKSLLLLFIINKLFAASPPFVCCHPFQVQSVCGGRL